MPCGVFRWTLVYFGVYTDRMTLHYPFPGDNWSIYETAKVERRMTQSRLIPKQTKARYILP